MSLASIWNIARRDVPLPSNAPTELLSEKHATFILKYGKTDNLFEYVMAEHLRLSGLYWCLTALDLMGRVDDADTELILQVINEARNDDGGYGAAKGHASHILHTLCAIQVLVTLGRQDLIDVDGIVKFVKSLQQDDGSFHGMTKEKDNDTRFAFCSVATLYFLNRLDAIDISGVVNYVLSCYNFDGGFGTYPKSESHAGQIYCCLGLLAVTNNLDRIDENKTARWLAERQCPSGGLCGRPEKLPDVCYSWWLLASLAILRRQHWIDKDSLVKFILASQDEELGGIADRPDDETDPFHTIFGLAGLSLLGFEGLATVDPVFCMTTRALGNLSFATKLPSSTKAATVSISLPSDFDKNSKCKILF